MANGHAYDGTYRFAVPCGLGFTISLDMRIYPSSYPYFPDPDSPVQWSGHLPTPDPDEDQGHLLGCNPIYGSSSISVVYLSPGAKHLHAEVQKYMGEEQGYLTWEGDFTIYVVRVTTNYKEVIDDAGFSITYTLDGYDGTGAPLDVFTVMWDDNGDGIFNRGPGSTFIKTWSPPAT
jgi:hypothetical protein